MWDPKVCVPEMAQSNVTFTKFHYFPLYDFFWRGGGGGHAKKSNLSQAWGWTIEAVVTG